MIKKQIHVVVGVSGGVDSAVSLYLLKQKGYKVTGLFMRNWDSFLNDEENISDDFEQMCHQEKDYQDAIKVCKILDVPLKRVDFVQEYWELVFQKTISDFKKGITPNPDIWCNKYIKFDLFYKYAREKLSADKIATGHYANTKKIKKHTYLTLAKDLKKDQTYFLTQINKDVLANVIFPLANYQKNEVRELAQKLKLPIANKKDSTGICFIGERKFSNFLKNYIKEKSGNIVDIKTNKIIGKHEGCFFYTIGQRKGLNLGGQSHPYYVCKKDFKKNILYVATIKDQSFLVKDSLIANNFNDLSFGLLKPKIEKEVKIKIRHTPDFLKGRVILKDKILWVKFNSLTKGITPGQWCAIYDNDLVLGSAMIMDR